MRHFNAAISFDAETPEGEIVSLHIEGQINGPIRSGRRGHIDNWSPNEGGELEDIAYFMTDAKGYKSRELTGKEIDLLQLEARHNDRRIASLLYTAYCEGVSDAQAAHGDYLRDCWKDEEALKG